jgi:hypothetical protein
MTIVYDRDGRPERMARGGVWGGRPPEDNTEGGLT